MAMRYLVLRQTPAYKRHLPSGQAVVRMKGGSHYLGPYDSPESREKYRVCIRRWIDRGLEAGWGPAEWRPAQTGHEGILTVAELLQGYDRCLDVYKGLPPVSFETRYAPEMSRSHEWPRELRRWVEADLRAEYSWRRSALPDWVHRGLVAVLGPVAVQVVGDRELERVWAYWGQLGHTRRNERKWALRAVEEAFEFVIGRKPRADWYRPTPRERRPGSYGGDRGYLGEDGVWVRQGSLDTS